MNILFDGFFNETPNSGIHRYTYNLIKCLPCKYNKFSTSSLTKSHITNHYIPFLKHFRPHRVASLVEYIWFRKKCNSFRFDLVHNTCFEQSNSSKYLINKGIPYVITIYDLIHEIFNEDKINIINKRKSILLEAGAVITISENTKKDLLRIYPEISVDKVFVTHLGLENTTLRTRNSEEINEKFILYVGHREGYKNFKFTLPVLKQINKKYSVNLVIVGPNLTQEDRENFKIYNVDKKIIFIGKISDKELNLNYQKCLAFMYPSDYEGFGYPLIEAMSNGAIPVAMDKSSIPEVLGNAGIILKSNNSENCANKLIRLIEDPTFRKQLKEKSIARAKFFDARKTAIKTCEIYKELIPKIL